MLREGIAIRAMARASCTVLRPLNQAVTRNYLRLVDFAFAIVSAARAPVRGLSWSVAMGAATGKMWVMS